MKSFYLIEILIVIFAILLTLWQLDFISLFSEQKASVSKVLYFLILCCACYFSIDSYKNKDGYNKGSSFLFIGVSLLFALLLVFSFFPENTITDLPLIKYFK